METKKKGRGTSKQVKEIIMQFVKKVEKEKAKQCTPKTK